MSNPEQEAYSRDGYAPLPGLFGREVMQAFHARLTSDLDFPRQSARFMTQGPLLSKDAIEVYGHVYPPLLNFLWALTPRVAQITGCELMPTYCYFRIYQAGDICRVHADRLACEHSLSLTIALSDHKPWALSVEAARLPQPTAGAAADFGDSPFGSVPMHEGDAVMYQGVHHRHGRLDPNPNDWSAHLFLHWVDAAGPYRDEAFDRPTLQRAGMLEA
jgi:hypothetical protein